MEYVFVGGRPSTTRDYSFASIRQTNNLLISMIDVLNSANSASKSFAFFKSLYEMHISHRTDINFNTFLDSGGYSIIVGDVQGCQTREFIEKYVTRIIEGRDIYDYVFSLDIPIFLEEPEYNTKDHIYEFNRMSLYETYERAKYDPILRNKLYFVWHFKIRDQYDIWNKLYTDLKLNDYVNNRAAGGMVGLRGVTQIDFSPFIAPLYRGLIDYLNGNTEIPFRFHALGVYIQHDRFFLCFLEKLFNHYLKTNTCHITYDSVNYMRTAQLKARALDIYDFNGTGIDIYPHISCPDTIYKEVYPGQLYDDLQQEIENVKNSQKLNNVDAFVPLNVYGNVQLDKFFNYIIEKYDILNKFLTGRMIDIFPAIAYAHPNVFSNRRLECIKMNFRQTWPFHQWFMNSKKYEDFHPLMYKFISDINFPASLQDAVATSKINTTHEFKHFMQE